MSRAVWVCVSDSYLAKVLPSRLLQKVVAMLQYTGASTSGSATQATRGLVFVGQNALGGDAYWRYLA